MRRQAAIAVSSITIIREDAVLKCKCASALAIDAATVGAGIAKGSLDKRLILAERAVVDHGAAAFVGDPAAIGGRRWKIICRLVPA